MVHAWPRAPTRHELSERGPTRLRLHLTAPCKRLDPTAANSCLTPQPGPHQKRAPRKWAEPCALSDSKQDGTAKLREKPAVAEKHLSARHAFLQQLALLCDKARRSRRG